MPIHEIREQSGVQPPSKVQGHVRIDEKRLEKVCQEFESILMHQMMKGARQTLFKTGFMEESKERELFQSFFDEEISKVISKRGGLGLGRMLFQQFGKKRENALSTKEVRNSHDGLEKRDGSLISPPRAGGVELSPTHQRDQKRGPMSEGRGDRAPDAIGQGD